MIGLIHPFSGYNMDIVKTLQKDQEIWDLYTRKVEYSPQVHDQYGRLAYWSTVNQNIFEPLVSKYLLEHGFHITYPKGKTFAVCLTHDIDRLYKTKALKGYDIFQNIHKRNFSKVMHSFLELRSKKTPWWNFSDIMDLEEKYGAKSSFYFMVQDPGDYEYSYDIEDCDTILGELSDGGWEVGLHGGCNMFNNPAEIKEKKQRLEKILQKNVIGYRNHYLRFQVPDTWEHLHSTMFHYDTTYGYADCIGFRNGMCYPFKPYNLSTNREIDILEIPINIMDTTLSHYMKLDFDKGLEMTKRLIDTVAKCHGVVTLLWHNNSIIDKEGSIYECILKYCSEKNAWMTSGEQISTWWKNSIKG
jgi:peptidoglycan/xylan/chitin deacetylase (PgdA/CDA1 family)